MSDTHLTELSLDRAIARVTFPAMFTFLFQILFELVDAWWLDRLGNPDVFASLGAAAFITWSLYALMLIVNAGVNSLVAQAAGARNSERYRSLTSQGIILSLGFASAVTLVMWWTHPTIFSWIGLTGTVHTDACDYFRILSFGYGVMMLYALSGVLFNAHGNTRTAMTTGVAALALNAVLDPLLILGLGGFPRMGVAGAALATILSQLLGLSLRAVQLIRLGYMDALPSRNSFRLPDGRAILAIGVPQALTHWIFSMVYPVLSYFLTRLNNLAALGALSVCHRIEGIPYFASVSLSITAATLAGQHYGAGNTDKAIKAVNRTVFYGSLILVIASLLYIFIPEKLIRLVVTAPDVVREGADYLRIIGYFELFLAWEVIFEGAFTGFGLTRWPMFVSVPLTLGRIPLAWLLAFHYGMGVAGVWWAISVTTLVKGVLIGGLFWSGGWKKKIANYELRIANEDGSPDCREQIAECG